MTLRASVKSLRRQVVFAKLRTAITRANRAWKDRFRVCHFSIQSNHVHLIIEAVDRESLIQGMRGLCVRIARNVNQLLRRSGRFFANRWHGRKLTTPRMARNVIVYVLANYRKHGEPCGMLDPYSSAPYFDGFVEFAGKAPCEFTQQPAWLTRLATIERPVAPATTWLLSVGWKDAGTISWEDTPRS
ncbi:MAG: hypothetical protein ACOY0T_02335 [Myxococcota bacterium]